MKRKTLQEWIDLYQRKTGDTVVLNDPARHLFYLPEKGFCQLSIDEKNSTLCIWECVGDGKFWRDFSLMEADGQGLSYLRTTTTRNIKAFLRCLWGNNFHFGMMGMLVCLNENGQQATCAKHKKGEWLIEVCLHNNKCT